jgi:hypothetical protein
MDRQAIFEKGYVAQWTKPTDRIGSTGRQVLEHSARKAVPFDCGSEWGCNGCRFHADGPTVQSAPNLLGANHYSGNHAVIAWYDTRCFLATPHRNGTGSCGWRDCGKLFRAGYARVRCRRVPVGNILHRRASGSQRLSVWGCYAGDRAAGSAQRVGTSWRLGNLLWPW